MVVHRYQKSRAAQSRVEFNRGKVLVEARHVGAQPYPSSHEAEARDHCEFKASRAYTASSRPASAKYWALSQVNKYTSKYTCGACCGIATEPRKRNFLWPQPSDLAGFPAWIVSTFREAPTGMPWPPVRNLSCWWWCNITTLHVLTVWVCVPRGKEALWDTRKLVLQ